MKILYASSAIENSLKLSRELTGLGHLIFPFLGQSPTAEHLTSLCPDLVICELSADSNGLPNWLTELENNTAGVRHRILLVGAGLSMPTSSPNISIVRPFDGKTLNQKIDEIAKSIGTEETEEDLLNLSRWQNLVARDEAIRRQVARELHGETGQYLTVVSLQLQALRRNLSDPEKLLAKVNETLKLLDEACLQVRNLTTKAWPTVLDHLGLIPALRSWASRVERERGLEVKLLVPEAGPRVGRLWEVVLYRVVEDTFETIAELSPTCIVKVDLADPPCRARLSIKCSFPGLCSTDHGSDRARPQNFEMVESRVLLHGGEFSFFTIEPEAIEIVVSFADCVDIEKKA